MHRNKKHYTLTETQKLLQSINMVLTKKDDEYKVNYKNGKEETAYYCDELDDALGTAQAMAKTRDIINTQFETKSCGYCGSTEGFETGSDGWIYCISCGGI